MMERIEGYKLVNFASQLDAATIEQAKQTASMPFVYPHVALMPDAHSGKGSAVGTVIPTVGAVIPAAVGVDIGCGMIAALTRFTEDDMRERRQRPGGELARLRVSIESAIPLSPGNYNKSLTRFGFTAGRLDELQHLADEQRVDLRHSPHWRQQLGSLGGGNHFIELCVDTRSRVWMFLHSGSRGVGNKIAQKHITRAQRLCKQRRIALPNRELAYLSEGTGEFAEYLRELQWAQRFALRNREEMMDRFAVVLAHYMGVDPGRVEVERVNTHHNYTTPERHGGKDVWLTRKGAIDAHAGKLGLIPGSMGAESYIVRGKGSAAGLCSAPHGAGRRYSRTKAKALFTVDDLAQQMRGIEYRHGKQWIDEIPSCYKPIDVVLADAADLVEVVTEMHQVLNVKGT